MKMLEGTLGKKDMKTMRVLLDAIVKLATDGAVEVRDKFVELIGEIKNAYGVAFFGDKLRDIQSQKLQKILSQKTEAKIEFKP